MISRRRLAASTWPAASLALILCACASTHPAAPGFAAPQTAYPPPPPPPPPPAGHGNPSSGAAPEYSIVRYIGVDSSGWTSEPTPQNYSDLYTRVELVGPPSEGAGSSPHLRDYALENRSWLSQVWSSKTNTVTMKADVNIADPAMGVSMPLFSVTYASGLKLGNTWTTNFTASDVSSPLFRIGPNTSVKVQLEAQVSTDFKSQGAAMAIGAITTAVQIASPASTLLTTLSKDEVGAKATAIDRALSGLLSKSISEQISLGRLADSWSPNASISLSGCAPFARVEGGYTPSGDGVCGSATDIDGHFDVPIGQWRLKLACPRLSVFDARDICHPIGGLTPPDDGVINLAVPANLTAAETDISNSAKDAEILSFKLASGTNIEAFVQAQTWYSTFIAAPTSGAAKTAADFTQFCSGAITGLESAGLSQLDSALVLRAMIRQMPRVTAYQAKFEAAEGADCKTRLQSFGITL
jgi:hypothetical protein